MDAANGRSGGREEEEEEEAAENCRNSMSQQLPSISLFEEGSVAAGDSVAMRRGS